MKREIFYLGLLIVFIICCNQGSQYPFEYQCFSAPYEIGDLNGAPDPNQQINYNRGPVCVKRSEPSYPELASYLKIEGSVLANILVSKNGDVRGAQIIKTDHEVFNKSVLDAVINWKYLPAYSNNNPVEIWLTIPFNFKLN